VLGKGRSDIVGSPCRATGTTPFRIRRAGMSANEFASRRPASRTKWNTQTKRLATMGKEVFRQVSDLFRFNRSKNLSDCKENFGNDSQRHE